MTGLHWFQERQKEPVAPTPDPWGNRLSSSPPACTMIAGISLLLPTGSRPGNNPKKIPAGAKKAFQPTIKFKPAGKVPRQAYLTMFQVCCFPMPTDKQTFAPETSSNQNCWLDMCTGVMKGEGNWVGIGGVLFPDSFIPKNISKEGWNSFAWITRCF